MVVHNPNNWHWVNKNCFSWSKDYFNENLKDLELDNDQFTITISDTSVIGDCDVTQRKGKVLCIYDMGLTFDVHGKDKLKDLEFKGSIKIEEFIHDETDYVYQLNNLGEYKADVRKQFIPLINANLLKFQADLIESHSSDVQE